MNADDPPNDQAASTRPPQPGDLPDGVPEAAPPPPPTLISSTEPTDVYDGRAYRLGYETGPRGAYLVVNKETGSSQRFSLTDEGWGAAWRVWARLEREAAQNVRAVFEDGAWTGPSRTRGLRTDEPWTQPPAGSGCQVCGRTPAASFVFRSNAGALYFRRSYRTEGSFCRDCARKAFRDHQYRNLTLGWWGLISFFATLVYLATNLGEIRKANALGEPAPVVDDERERQLRGRSLVRRPLAWIAVVGLIGGFVALGIVQSRDQGPGLPPDKVLLADDFSDPVTDPWPEFDDARGSGGYFEQAYHVVVKRAEGAQVVDNQFRTSSSLGAVVVETKADYTRRDGPTGFFGVRCVSSHQANQAYEFIVIPETNHYLIVRQDHQATSGLTGGVSTVIRDDDANVIRGECTTEAGFTELSISINGSHVADARDGAIFDGFRGVGLVAGSYAGGTEVTFYWIRMERRSTS